MADIFEQILSQAAPRGDYGNMFATDPFTRGRLLAEAELKSQRQEEMVKQRQPLDLENIRAQIQMHQAQSNQYNAMAEKYKHDATFDQSQRYADRIAKQKQLEELMANRAASGQLEGIMGIPQVNDPNQEVDPRTEAIRAFSKSAPSNIRAMLEPTPGISNYTNENVQQIIQRLREQDPQASKSNIAGINAQALMDKTKMQTESNEKIADVKARVQQHIANQKPVKGESPGQAYTRNLNELVASGDLSKANAFDLLQEATVASINKVQPALQLQETAPGKFGMAPPKANPKASSKLEKEETRELNGKMYKKVPGGWVPL